MRKWGTIGTILLLFLALASATSCGDGQEEVSQQLIDVVRGDLMVSVSGSGNIVVSNEANLTFGSGGKIAKIYVDEGDKVRKGQSLARLDTGPLKLALAQVQAARDQAKAAIDQAEYALEQVEEPFSEGDIDSAEAAVDAAEEALYYALWMLDKAEEGEEAAEEALYQAKQGGDPDEIAAAEAALQQAEAAVRQWDAEVFRAQASLLAAEAQLEAMEDAPDEAAVEAAESQLKAAELQLKAAELAVTETQKQLDEAVITAPFDGEVTSVHAEEGDIFSPTGMPVIHLIDLTSMELEVEVDEIDVAEVKAGQRAIIEVDALPALQLGGEVKSISTLSKEMGGLVLYEVTISFDIPQGYNLKIGMSAIADIIFEERSNVLLVPNRAISQDSQGNSVVKVMVDEEIEERPVVTGISDGFDTEIVDGLNEGDVVVIETKVKSSGSGGLFG